MSIDLKSLNLKRHGNTFIKVLMDMKVLGLLILIGFTFYGIGYETVYKPNMEMLKSREEAIKKEKEALDLKKGLQSQYKVWEQELKGLDIGMVPIPPGDSVKVVSVTESSKLLNLAKGIGRNELQTPALEPPHNIRKGVVLTPGTITSMDLLAADPNAPPAAAAPAPQEGAGRGMKGGGASEATAAPTSVPVERFDFEMKMSGTYPALVDFVNQLITHNNLIKINKVSFAKVVETEEPDPKDFPDYAVPVEMTLTLSMFLYEAPLQPVQ